MKQLFLILFAASNCFILIYPQSPECVDGAVENQECNTCLCIGRRWFCTRMLCSDVSEESNEESTQKYEDTDEEPDTLKNLRNLYDLFAQRNIRPYLTSADHKKLLHLMKNTHKKIKSHQEQHRNESTIEEKNDNEAHKIIQQYQKMNSLLNWNKFNELHRNERKTREIEPFGFDQKSNAANERSQLEKSERGKSMFKVTEDMSRYRGRSAVPLSDSSVIRENNRFKRNPTKSSSKFRNRELYKKLHRKLEDLVEKALDKVKKRKQMENKESSELEDENIEVVSNPENIETDSDEDHSRSTEDSTSPSHQKTTIRISTRPKYRENDHDGHSFKIKRQVNDTEQVATDKSYPELERPLETSHEFPNSPDDMNSLKERSYKNPEERSDTWRTKRSESYIHRNVEPDNDGIKNWHGKVSNTSALSPQYDQPTFKQQQHFPSDPTKTFHPTGTTGSQQKYLMKPDRDSADNSSALSYVNKEESLGSKFTPSKTRFTASMPLKFSESPDEAKQDMKLKIRDFKEPSIKTKKYHRDRRPTAIENFGIEGDEYSPILGLLGQKRKRSIGSKDSPMIYLSNDAFFDNNSLSNIRRGGVQKENTQNFSDANDNPERRSITDLQEILMSLKRDLKTNKSKGVEGEEDETFSNLISGLRQKFIFNTPNLSEADGDTSTLGRRRRKAVVSF